MGNLRPDVAWDGIDSFLPLGQDPPNYKRVVRASVENFLASSPVESSYDSILLSDVLEHLVDPLYVLHGLARHLTPGGKVVVSVPNVAHWSVRKDLLMGRWEYTDEGILDRTHLRFLTLATAAELMRAGGYRIESEYFPLSAPRGLRSFPRLTARFPGLFSTHYAAVLSKTED